MTKPQLFKSFLTKAVLNLHETLAVEMCKVANNISLEIMKNVFNFCREIRTELRQQNFFIRPVVDLVYNDTERVCFVDSKIWDMIPENMKKLESQSNF